MRVCVCVFLRACACTPVLVHHPISLRGIQFSSWHPIFRRHAPPGLQLDAREAFTAKTSADTEHLRDAADNFQSVSRNQSS